MSQQSGGAAAAGALWACEVCETVNQGGRLCRACGAPLTRRAAAVTAVRDRVAPPPSPPLAVPRPLPDPVRRAVDREPVPDDEWAAYEEEARWNVTPLPGGCLFSFGPRSRGF